MKLLWSICAATALARAALLPVVQEPEPEQELDKRATPLAVQLEMVGNSLVKASVTNAGSKALKLFKGGSLLGEHAVERTEIFSEGSRVEFDGLRLRLATTDLPEEAFTVIPAGETVDVTWDVAETHDLSAGGAFDVVATGAISYAELGSVDLAGSIPYASNALTVDIDGAQADEVRSSFHATAKRQILQADCTGLKGNLTQNAIANCGKLAAKAQIAAREGPIAKVEEYFHSSTNQTRTQVEAVFRKVAAECGNVTTGVARYYCSDVYRSCYDGVLAYTMPSRSFMVNCALYFNALAPLSTLCHAQDQTTTTLHETTHLTQVKGTEDYGVYGYKGVKQLTNRQAMNHADTYALFANAIHVGC